MTMRNRRPVATGPRRKFAWARNFIRVTNSAGFTQDLLSGWKASLGLNAMLPGTTATRLIIHADGTGVVASSAVDRFVMGIRVGDLASPPAIADHPIDEPFSDWMWTGMLVSNGGRNYDSFRADIKSKRKIARMNNTLYLVTDNPDGLNFDMVISVDVLLQLP